MSATIPHVPVEGMWLRHVAAGLRPLAMGTRGQGRWQRAEHTQALYLAEDEATVWAEWYRALAERSLPPATWLPRELWRCSVSLDNVADVTDPVTLSTAGLAPTLPSAEQWPAYQRLGERLAAAGASGVLYASAARPEGRCLCVFAHAIGRVRPVGEPRLIDAPPAPPRGMRT